MLIFHTDKDQPQTPPSSGSSPNDPPEFLSQPNDLSEDEAEYDKQRDSQIGPKKGGYDGRIQQILYETPDLEILITEAFKSPDGGHIVYRIRTGVSTKAHSEGNGLTKCRISRCPDGTQNSARYAMHLSTFTLLWLYLQYQRSTQWQTMRRTLPRRKRTRGS